MMLNRNIIICAILLLPQIKSLSQQSGSITSSKNYLVYDLFHVPGYTYRLTSNESWAKFKHTKTFENQDYNRSEYLALNPDSTFEFVSFYETGNSLSFGKWSKLNKNEIELNSNEELVFKSIFDIEVLKKYNISRAWCTGLRIKNLILNTKDNKLITQEFNKARETKTITFINKQAELVDKTILFIRSDTNDLYNPGGYVVGHSIDSAFFNDRQELVKFIRNSKWGTEKGEIGSSRKFYHFLPRNHYRAYFESTDSSNTITTEYYYFEDQKLVKAFGTGDVHSPNNVHSTISHWKKHIVFGKKIKY